jgi:hypothetical protein
MHVGTFEHLCKVKSFRKVMSMIMDDFEVYDSTIDNLHMLSHTNNLRK